MWHKLQRNITATLDFTFPTDGNPISATRASPDLRTSNPSPFSPFFAGSNSSDLYFANFAFNKPKWYSVANWKDWYRFDDQNSVYNLSTEHITNIQVTLENYLCSFEFERFPSQSPKFSREFPCFKFFFPIWCRKKCMNKKIKSQIKSSCTRQRWAFWNVKNWRKLSCENQIWYT